MNFYSRSRFKKFLYSRSQSAHTSQGLFMKNSKVFAILISAAALIAGCGGGGGNSSEPANPSPNTAPIAAAGLVQTVSTGSLVTLNGTGSDANGDQLSYTWTLSVPAGSASVLSSTGLPQPTFTPDIAGAYIARLVVNDGKASSAESAVTVTAVAANLKPIADAGQAQFVLLGSNVTLDGTASSDPNRDPIVYSWTLLNRPSGSAAILNSSILPKPTFVADIAGIYVALLVVNDGKSDSAIATVTITAAAANVPPVALAGPGQNVVTGMLVTLDGTGSSDANGDNLTFAWVLDAKPAGSNSTIVSPASARPTFIPDVAGVYLAALTVNDGHVSSSASTVSINVALANAAPVADAGPSRTVISGLAVALDGSGSSDANGDPIAYFWSPVSAPLLAYPVLSSYTVPRPTFVAELSGQYVFGLTVFDDKGARGLDSTVTITAVTPFTSISIFDTANDAHDPPYSYNTTYSWNAIPGATSYELVRGVLPLGASQVSYHVFTTSATSAVWPSPCSGIGSSYRLIAYDSSGIIAKSDIVYFLHRLGKLC